MGEAKRRRRAGNWTVGMRGHHSLGRASVEQAARTTFLHPEKSSRRGKQRLVERQRNSGILAHCRISSVVQPDRFVSGSGAVWSCLDDEC